MDRLNRENSLRLADGLIESARRISIRVTNQDLQWNAVGFVSTIRSLPARSNATNEPRAALQRVGSIRRLDRLCRDR